MSIIIGITGGSGVGKTTLCHALVAMSDYELTLLSHDSYYNCLGHLPVNERALANFDEPQAFENTLLQEHLLLLKQGQTVDVPEYDFTTHTRTKNVKQVRPVDIVLVEGILLLADVHIRKCCDYMIYVDLDADIRFVRRMQRDIEVRGRTLDSVIDQYLSTVRPMHNKYIEPVKDYVDFIVTNENIDATTCQISDYINTIMEN